MLKIRRLLVLTCCIIAIIVVAQVTTLAVDWIGQTSHLSAIEVACNSGAGAGGEC